MNRIAVDVGGTFTDVFLIGPGGQLVVHKVPSTPADPSAATVQGMREACEKAALPVPELAMILHGTTVATNTVLQRTGAKVGLITTEGFRDILHIARHKKPLNFSLYQELPWQKAPLVPRRLRLTVRERVEPPEGKITKPLDEGHVAAALEALGDEHVEAVAICFLHSYMNPAHELRVGELVRKALPDAFLSLRHEVCPEHREYESFNTVALNAYLGPVTSSYLDRLGRRLAAEGQPGNVLFMTSTGGVESTESVTRKPVNMLLSGLVAGVVGGRWAGRASGFENLITLDVGGTSADVGVIHRGQLRHKHWLDNEIGGFRLRLSMIDVSTIGAGGGSIAYVDRGGMLHVGPRSAGAEPGPACYGRGGEEPTVTDAQLLLGRLSEGSFLGGRMAISRRRAEDALRARVAGPLGLDVPEAAAGVVRIVAAHMVDAIELNSVRRGYDPREFALVAFGGAGPLFATDIARRLGIPSIVVPRFPGIASAMGLLASDVVVEYSGSVVRGLEDLDHAELERRFGELGKRAELRLLADGFAEGEIVVERYVECRYAGQGYELRLTAPSRSVDSSWIAEVEERFHSAHEREYAHAIRDAAVELVNLGVRGIGALPELEAPEVDRPDAAPSPHGTRAVWFEELGAPAATPLYARNGLGAGHVLDGPAIVEQEDSTVLVPPGARAEVDRVGNIVVSLEER